MKKVTSLLLVASLALPAVAHDCECECGDGHGQKAGSAVPVVQEAPAAGAGDGKAAVPEVKEGVQDDKTTLQKFLDHPPASDAAKKRMKKR